MTATTPSKLGCGHRQLLDAECRALGAAWRGAAVLLQREHHQASAALRIARHIAAALGAAAVATAAMACALWLVLPGLA